MVGLEAKMEQMSVRRKWLRWLFGPAFVVFVGLAIWAFDGSSVGPSTRENLPVVAETKSPVATYTPPINPETEKALANFQSLPDPMPPVSADKIQGMWWSESDSTQRKVFAFVEKENASANPYKAILSTSAGVKLVVQCDGEHPPKRHTSFDIESGKCAILPLFTWIRVAMSNVIFDPDASEWGLAYRAEGEDVVSDFTVMGICYPNGYCSTFEEAGERAIERMRENGRRGEANKPVEETVPFKDR